MTIERIIISYLSDYIDAFGEYPEDHPSRFVVIEKTGSSEENHIASAMIAIQSYAPSLEAASNLNETIKELMEDIVSLDKICNCRLNSDYNFTDQETKEYRYQAVFDIKYYRRKEN